MNNWEDSMDNQPPTSALNRFQTCERGATAIEYALIASLIGVILLGAITALGTSLEQSFDNSTNAINNQ